MTKKTLHMIVSVVLCFSIVLAMSSFLLVSAADPVKGTVNASAVNVRTGPGTNHSVLTCNNVGVKLNTGHSVTVLETVNTDYPNATANLRWYRIKFTYNNAELTGYIATQYVDVEMPEYDYTMPTGVPAEYKTYIENILKYHPNWKFVFYDTGLDWNSLFSTSQQGYVGRSLIPYTDPLSYRSTASGCYDWNKDQWIAQDSNQWFQANSQTIAYYMDPRNFLNINDLFMFESLSYDKSTQTLAGVEQILKGTFMDGVKIKDTNGKEITYAEAFIKAAETTGVSPYHLASRSIQEVGRNGSASVKGNGSKVDDNGTIKYKGYYNFYNIGATQGKYPIANGLRYASGETSSEANKAKYMLPWDSQYKAIVGGAIWIGNGYINSVYKQNTLYFQKFNTSGGNAGHQYMGNIKAPASESRSIKATYSDLGILDGSFTFIIPYYKNMPSTACALPASDNRNLNNRLNALYVIDDDTGKDYVSGFSGSKFSWNLGSLVSRSVTVKATAVSSKATVSGTGKVTLKNGVNTINIVVTAENGQKQTYTVTFNNSVITVTDQKLGDVDNDGVVTITDALLIFKHKSGESVLSPIAQKAADTNKNGSVDITDALLIFKYKSGEITSF